MVNERLPLSSIVVQRDKADALYVSRPGVKRP